VTQPIYQVKAEFFKVLGHPGRIRILEVLRDGERSVGELIPEVGLEASHLSQQLGLLRRAGILTSRKEGATVFYSVTDRRIFVLLQVSKEILTTTLTGSGELLAELEALDFGVQRSRRRRGAG
jgi:ArsR family transcriptional regulator